MLGKYISKTILCKLFSDFEKDYLKSNFYLHYANENPRPFHLVFMESCCIYENLYLTVLYDCFEF
jgi:hypothetical protein